MNTEEYVFKEELYIIIILLYLNILSGELLVSQLNILLKMLTILLIMFFFNKKNIIKFTMPPYGFIPRTKKKKARVQIACATIM